MSLFFPILFSLFAALNQPKEANIVFVGDAMQHQKQIDTARQSNGVYDYTGLFDNIATYISSADYAVVNLETPTAGGRYSGYPMFNAPDNFVTALKVAGFDMALTANNHALDRRDDGIRKTITCLDKNGFDHIGTYNNASARKHSIPFIKNIKNFKVGFLNYTFGTNGLTPREDVIVDYIDKAQIKNDIKNTRDAGAEIIVVAIHWGVEYQLLPHPSQKELAKFLIDQGVDMIIGGHPHVIQPMEVRNNPVTGKKSLVIYSMGNFVSNMLTTNTRGGVMLRTKLIRDKNGIALFDSASYRLVYVNQPTASHPNYWVVPIDDDTNISTAVPQLSTQCHAFITNATRLLGKNNINVPRYKK